MPDKVDFEIVSELFQDSRISFNAIAKKLGIAPGTVHNRFKKMQEKGEIHVCTTNVDLAKFGYQCKIFLMMKISKKENKAEVMEKISKIANVISTAGIIGDFDIMVVAVSQDMKHLDKTVKEIRAVGIEQLEISLSIRENIPLLPDKPI